MLKHENSKFTTVEVSKWKKIQLPNLWCYSKLGDKVKFSNGEFLPEIAQIAGKIPIYGGNGFIGYHNEYFVDQPTLVIGRVGVYCGSVYSTNGKIWVTDNAIYAKKISNDLDIEYLYYYLLRLDINALAEISAQPKISQAILDRLIILYPKEKTEQRKIALILKNLDSLIVKSKEIVAISESLKDKQNTKNLEYLKKGLMNKLLTGKIRVKV